MGKQIALILRKLVLLTGNFPCDASVENIFLRCYLTDNVSERKFLFMPWLYDLQERELISKQLASDGIFVDIGANVGIYTLWACLNLQSRGRILAIEPNPPVYQRLLFNLGANQAGRDEWPDITTLQIAIGEKDETLNLHLQGSNLGASSIVRNDISQDHIQVRCRPLLKVLEETGIDHIDILKIDVEGAEDLALTPFLEKTGMNLLPGFLIIENSEHLWQSDLEGLIKQRGYEIDFRTRMNTVYRLNKSG